MSAKNRHLYVLSGGAGTRLWPFSRETFPKQFFDLTGSGQPLFIETLSRLKGLGSLHVLTTELLHFSSMGLLKRHNLEAKILSEPAIRNTAAAVGLATLTSLRENPEAVVGVFPADHFVKKPEIFRSALTQAFEVAAQGNVVTLGIQPSYPATAYGYMELKDRVDNKKDWQGPIQVSRFVEKPTFEKAQELLNTQRAVWNAGVFVFPAKFMAELYKKHLPEMWHAFENVHSDFSNLKEVYSSLESVSVDVGIMEKVSNLQCIPVEMGWSDVGSWEEVVAFAQDTGVSVNIESSGNFYENLQSVTPKTSVFVGVSDLMVLDTPDALLIASKGSGQKVKEAVQKLKITNARLLKEHAFESRPWGRFEILTDEPHYKSKKITVMPGQKLSYQSHSKRAEQWVVVKGKAEVTLNDQIHHLEVGESIQIPLGAKHRMNNPGTIELEFIEVQTGSYFGEDDIIRYSDDYGRG